MSDPVAQSSVDDPSLTDGAPELPTDPPAVRQGRSWVRLCLAVAAGLLIGAVAATAVVLVVNRPPENEYAVTVFLMVNASAEQKAAIESALHGLHPVDGIQFEDHAQAYQHFKELFKDHPDFIARTSANALPESYRLRTRGRVFDCAAVAPVRHLLGVDEIHVIQEPVGGHPGAAVACV